MLLVVEETDALEAYLLSDTLELEGKALTEAPSDTSLSSAMSYFQSLQNTIIYKSQESRPRTLHAEISNIPSNGMHSSSQNRLRSVHNRLHRL